MNIDQSLIAIYRQTVLSLFLSILPEFAPDQYADVVQAFELLERSLSTIFFQHADQGFLNEWLLWMNEGLSQYSNNTVSLQLANRREAQFLLVFEGEEKLLVLHPRALRPLEFVPRLPAKQWDWPAW